jgi:prepilin-type N-terminal cleavage/methylation domain-containing protein
MTPRKATRTNPDSVRPQPTPASLAGTSLSGDEPGSPGLGCPRGDAGVTLVELVVSMTIMGIFMAMFTAAATQMFRFETNTETATSAQTQIHLAFLRLDKDIRYATGISAPSTAYVEYLRTDEGQPVCAELWMDATGRALKSRTWPQGTTPASSWTTLATDASSALPFTLIPPAPPFNSQQLRLTITVGPPGGTSTAKLMDVTFTALNTSSSTASSTVCTEGRLSP